MVCRGIAVTDFDRAHDTNPEDSFHPKYSFTARAWADIVDHGDRRCASLLERGGGNRIGSFTVELFPVVSGDLVELLRVDAGRETMVHEAVYSLVINRDDGSSDFYLIICSRLLVCHVAHG